MAVGHAFKYTVAIKNTGTQAEAGPFGFIVQLPSGVSAVRGAALPAKAWAIAGKRHAPVQVVVDAQANTVAFESLVFPAGRGYTFTVKARVVKNVPAGTQLTVVGALYNQGSGYAWDPDFDRTVRVTGKA